MAQVGSVLVIRLSALGDVVFALPAVQALLRSGIAERVSWLVEERCATLVQDLPGLHDVVVFPRHHKSAWPGHALAMRRRSDDVVVDMQGNLKSRGHLAFLTAPRKIGFDAPFAREGAERGLTERHAVPHWAHHKALAMASLLTPLGLPLRSLPRPDIPIGDASRAEAERLADVPGSGPLVLLTPGSSRFAAFKRWAPRHFGALGQRLRDDLGARILVAGGPGEEHLMAATAAALAPAAPGVLPPSVPTLVALLDRVDLVVASDSFGLHMANALGTPVVGLYGPKNPAITGPIHDRAAVVRALHVACSPCSLRRCSDPICMQRLEVDAVFAACLTLLESAR